MDLKQFLRNNNKILDKLNMVDLMFEAYLTHESTSQLEPDDIPQTKDPVWILGVEYNALKGEIHRFIRLTTFLPLPNYHSSFVNNCPFMTKSFVFNNVQLIVFRLGENKERYSFSFMVFV